MYLKTSVVLILASLLVGCTVAPAKTLVPSQLPISTETKEISTATITAFPTNAITITPTVEPERVYDPADPDSWIYLPVIPEAVSDRVIEIYRIGQSSGTNPRAFSKVGDCETYTPYFLAPFDWKETGYRLGEYESLRLVIDQFRGSFARQSVAAKQGFSVASVLSPLWSDPDQCRSGQSPVSCEYVLHKPAFALIMFGTNDVASSREVFEANLRTLVDVTISYNVVPILATKADNLEGDGSINAIIAKVANEYQLPLWNYWKALQEIPDGGLSEDQTHLTYAQPFFDSPENMQKGWPLRNLTALQVLEKVWQEVEK